jgi:glycosyltransferase involved in cell wall biosynthesis
MNKILFISNISRSITNFAIPSIKAAQNMGYEFHAAANYENFDDDISKYNITLHQIDLNRQPLNLKNIKAFKQLLELLRKENFDVIHCNTPIGGVLGRLCGWRAKVPIVIYTAHGFNFYEGAPLKNWLLFYPAERILAHFTDNIITINQEDFKQAKKFRLRKDGKAYYVPGVGVDTSSIKLAVSKRQEIMKELEINDSAILLISVGELNRNKNYHVIIKALGKLRNLNIHYIICGVGDKMDMLISLAKENNIEGNVHFLGYRTDVPQLLKSCDIFVMPSYREGLSRSMMEAMSAGLPCIASKIRGNVDLIEVGKGGYLSLPDDVDGFADAIHRISEDVLLREQMGIYNLEAVKLFDIEIVKSIMKDIYEELFNRRNARG